ncbi:MAG TPA: Smr/MutS family protein [Pyrinomonadaceae bacterium]|nr:Smr/MutS family protein [Pyrinomonadaceae bacterium]
MKLLNWLRDLGRSTTPQRDSELDPDDPFPEPVEVEITDVFDLHTIQPREVKLVVEEYLHQAHEMRFESVRIIHGKGIGVQREMVRSILAKTPFVMSWTDAPAEAGGWGATIVRLQTDD